MNIYVVVEGRVVEKAVFKVWIPQVNKALRPATYLEDVVENHFYIVSGNGYPNYLDVIDGALQDVSVGETFGRLVICVDSEDMTREEKRDEIDDYVKMKGYAHIDYRIVVQHFCFEAWALGNRRIGARNPQNPSLVAYRQLYNVMSRDPEGLPPLAAEQLNRSQFAEKYLRLMLNEKNKNLTYSKGNPKVVAHPKYFAQLRSRLEETHHIASFGGFLEAFA